MTGRRTHGVSMRAFPGARTGRSAGEDRGASKAAAPSGYRGIARGAVVLVLCVVLAAMSLRPADASDRRQRNLAIGAGIVGAIIAEEIARNEERKKKKGYRSRGRKGKASRATRRKPRIKPAQSRGKVRNAADKKPALDAAAAPKQPAATAVAAPPPATTAAPISTPSEIAAAQQHLRYMGYDVPEASGVLDLKTRMAIMQFQESIGGELTGVLTLEQLQALFVKADAKAQSAAHR